MLRKENLEQNKIYFSEFLFYYLQLRIYIDRELVSYYQAQG